MTVAGLYTAGPNAGASTVRVTDSATTPATAEAVVNVTGSSPPIDQTGWTLEYVDSEEATFEATLAFDGLEVPLRATFRLLYFLIWHFLASKI